MVSYWYPPQYQGFALGLAGAGNSGTVFASLLAPTLAVMFGWRNVLGLAALPLIAVFVYFLLAAKDSPKSPPRKTMADYARLLGKADAWWLMFFYSVSFGGFVGLSSFLPIYFHDQYGLSAVTAGYFTAACVFVGSFARPFGGALADRVGGTRTLSFIYALVAALLLIVSRGVLPAECRTRHADDRDGGARHGQRRGVPARPAALRRRCRGDERPGRHDRRRRRVLPRRQPRLRQAVHRQLRRRLRAVRGSRAWRPGPGSRGCGCAGGGMPPRSPACAFKGAGHEHDRRPAKTSRRHRQRHGRHAHGRGTAGARRRRTAIASPCSAPSRM